ncbi:putative acyltransferase, putative [Verrucomicrobiia bacterium DG1235]|nr:putative acyltransferase, putative [Verrucomicrobiae bacterium DG1235]
MNATSTPQVSSSANALGGAPRLDYLDAVRAFALLLGIVFHASLSFSPIYIGWAVMDISTSPLVLMFMHVSHSFRMEVFFLIAGFFGHMTFHRKGGGAFLKSRFMRIVVPFLVGWFLLKPLVNSGWAMGFASLRGDVDILAGLGEGFKALEMLPAGIFVGSHLWFLYYLVLVTLVALVARGLVKSNGPLYDGLMGNVDSMFTWLSRSGFSVFLLALPTSMVVWFMSHWGVDTPDKTLVPHAPALILYSGFFVFGWVLHRNAELMAGFARLTVVRWVVLGVGIVVSFVLSDMQSDTGHPQYELAHAGFVASYAVMMWSLVFMTIGVFKKLCRRANPIVRYIADASYWLYLIHLPIVVWLQVAVAELPFHWSLKLAGVSVATILFALLTYDLFVRSTFVGAVLNGRRRTRALAGLMKVQGGVLKAGA